MRSGGFLRRPWQNLQRRRQRGRLAALAPNTAIDWSDSWTDSDLQEFTAASVLGRG